MKRSEIHRKTPMRRTGRLARTPIKAAGKPLPFRSKKQAARYVERRRIVARLLAERPRCEWPGCNRASVDVHEIVRRSQADVLLVEDVMRAVCRECHDYIGLWPREAERFGMYLRGSDYRMQTAALPTGGTDR